MPASQKTAKSALFIILFLITIAIVVGGSIYLANHLSTTKSVAQTCPTTPDTNHRVIIRQGVVTPSHTATKRCDSLTITNLDDTNRLMAFGRHEDHQPYDGIEERLLGHGQSLEVRLVKSGSFRFHDHLDDAVQGTFAVSKG